MSMKSSTVCIVGLVVSMCLFAHGVSEVSNKDDAIFLRITENGPVIVREPGLPHYGSFGMTDDPSVVWSHNLTDAIYNTASNTVDGYVFAGTYLNPPMEAELFAPTGGGIPEWGYAGNEFYTDAGDNSFMLAGIDEDAAGVNVVKWTGPGNGTPDWTTSFPGYALSTYGPFAVSDDGSTIAAIAAPAGADAHLLLFDADSGTPLIDYTATATGFPRVVKINADGRYTAFIALATLVVFDRDSLDVRDRIAMGFSNSAMDISGDGDLLAYGWQYMQIMQWNGSSYAPYWSYSIGSDYYVTRIAISADGSTIVSCWNISTLFNTLKIVVHEAGSSTPLWTYDYPVSSGIYQEAAYDVETTDDGRYFIVGSLGDDANINPEVHIFQRDTTPYVYYTVDMPGSMFSVDISSDGSYATAAGKHIHANAFGRGGDIVLINTGLTGVEDDNSPAFVNDFTHVTAYPNPFTHSTKIRYSVQDSRYSIPDQAINIYDAAGKLVKVLHPVSRIQDQGSAVFWDGTDSSERKLPAGIYFIGVQTENGIVTNKIVKSE